MSLGIVFQIIGPWNLIDDLPKLVLTEGRKKLSFLADRVNDYVTYLSETSN